MDKISAAICTCNLRQTYFMAVVAGLSDAAAAVFAKGWDLGCDPTGRAIQDGNAISILNVGLDIAGSHTLGVYR